MFLLRITTKKYNVFVIGILMSCFVFFSHNAAGSENSINYFESLQKRLIEDGLDKDRINELYKRPEVSFEKKGISRFLVHNEATLNYKQFTTRKSIKSHHPGGNPPGDVARRAVCIEYTLHNGCTGRPCYPEYVLGRGFKIKRAQP
jgi:hypothetical protein